MKVYRALRITSFVLCFISIICFFAFISRACDAQKNSKDANKNGVEIRVIDKMVQNNGKIMFGLMVKSISDVEISSIDCVITVYDDSNNKLSAFAGYVSFDSEIKKGEERRCSITKYISDLGYKWQVIASASFFELKFEVKLTYINGVFYE